MLPSMLTLLSVILAGALFPAVQAPGVGDNGASAFLAQVQALLYRPQDDGLQSVSFVAPIIEDGEALAAQLSGPGMSLPKLPKSLRMADVAVNWTLASGPVVTGTVSDKLPPELVNVAQQLQAVIPQRGNQLIAVMLNRTVDFDNLQAFYDANLTTGQADSPTVVFSRKDIVSESMAPATRITWTFEADGTPLQSVTELPAQPAARMPPSVINSTHYWRRVGRSGRLLLEALSVVSELQTAGQLDLLTTFHYIEIDGITLLSGLTEVAEQKFGPNSPPAMTKTTLLEKLVVNGEPLGGR
jgi:hypothetical protein